MPSIPGPLISVQRTLAYFHGLEHYYTNTYRYAEYGYWKDVYHWMREMTPRKYVLDIGTAYGTLACVSRRLWPDATITCVDATCNLSFATGPYFRLSFRHADIEFAALLEKVYDLVIATEVLEHLNFHPREFFQKIHDALTTDGVLLLSTPDAEVSKEVVPFTLATMPSIETAPSDYVWKDRGHVCLYTQDQLRDLLVAAGFHVPRWGMSSHNGHINIKAYRI